MNEKKSLDRLVISAGRRTKERDYWLDRLAGELPKSNVPQFIGFPGQDAGQEQAKPCFQEAAFEFDKDLSKRFRDLSTGSDVRLHIILTAILTLLLGKYTGNEDIITASPVLKPDPGHAQDDDLINKVLPVRNLVSDRLDFKELLMKVRESIVEADKNRNYPMELLFKQLGFSPLSIHRRTRAYPEQERQGKLDHIFDLPYGTAILLENIHERHYLDGLEPPIIFSFLNTGSLIRGKVEYWSPTYNEETIRRLIAHYRHLANQVLQQPQAQIANIEILLPEEKQQLVNNFNRPPEVYPTTKTIHGMFMEQAEKTPTQVALVHAGEFLTYQQLNQVSGQVAGVLIEQGVEPGSVVAIMSERSHWMICGILGILKTAAAYLPINPQQPSSRTRFMLTDSAVNYLVTTTNLAEAITALEMPHIQDIFIDQLAIEEKEEKGDRPERIHSIAYIIYTSGSTGQPKGVPVSHANFCPLIHWGCHHLGLTTQDRVIQNLSYYFDWSVWEIFIALVSGSSLYMITEEILLNPEKEVDFISANGITVLHITPTQFQYLMNTGKPMHTLKHLCIGAEKLTYEVLKRSIETVQPQCRIYNMYGPTEATIIAAVLEIDRSKAGEYQYLSSVPIGSAAANNTLLVLDKHWNRCPIGVTGELFIAGDGLAGGYLNRPELSAERFIRKHSWRSSRSGNSPKYHGELGSVRDHKERSSLSMIYQTHLPSATKARGACTLLAASPQLTSLPSPPATLYKSGDRCRWLPDGTVEFLGRQDFQVKIRGHRIECGEIENRLLQHESIKAALVTVKAHESGEDFLCAYVVPAPTTPAKDGKGPGRHSLAAVLREYLRQDLPEYMVPAYFVQLEKMPLNPNGKVDLKALPDPGSADKGVPHVEPRDEIEKKMAATWARVLSLTQLPGIDDNFFELGGHSLTATTLVYQIYKEFEVNIEIEDVFEKPTIREISQQVKEHDVTSYTAVEPVEEKEYYPMSYAQRRLWVLCQFEADSTAYNMPFAVGLRGSFDTTAFEQAVQSLARRHDSFRTIFTRVDGEPRQRVISRDDFNYYVEIIDLRNLPPAQQEKEVRRLYTATAGQVFNLETGPLFCFKLLRPADEEYLLLFNMHHIVNDGWSQGVITRELITLYNANVRKLESPLQPMELQYKDYTYWHNSLILGEGFSSSREYWLERFKDKPNGIELPYDHPRHAVQTFNGGRVPFVIDAARCAALKPVGNSEDATLFMLLLSLVSVFMYRYSGQTDILIGSPIANRKRPELGNLVGFLVNTLVYRVGIDAKASFKQQLKAVKKETLAAYRYQDYPFDLLVEQLDLERDLSQSPLFNVMLAHNNAESEGEKVIFDGIEFSNFPYLEEFNMSKFDLIFFMDEGQDGIYTRIEYNSDLFERSTIERMAANFLAFIDEVAAHPGSPVNSLSVMTEEEYTTVTQQFNDTEWEFPPIGLQQMLANQAEKNPEKIAVFPPTAHPSEKDGISYRELHEKANRLAHFLKNEYNVKANDIIGVSMDRSIAMIAVLLGIVKAGAAYLAVDPTYPRERVLHVLADSRCGLLVIDRMRPQLFSDYPGKILDIFEVASRITGQPAHDPGIVNQPQDILYVNYTSGSTGTPNGAMLSHDCLTNLILWQHEKTTIDCSLRVLQFTSINFCVSFQEIMGTLSAGGELHLIGDIERQDIDYLMDFLVHHRIEVLFLPFSYLNFLFNESSRWASPASPASPGAAGNGNAPGDTSGDAPAQDSSRPFEHSLKHIITAGEQLKITAGLKKFLDENPHIQLHNHYGSTEMHVVSSYTLDASTAAQTPIPPAGKPISNVQIFILDEYLHPVPSGVYGELCVAGSLEILGYINNEELTNKKLVDLPHLAPVRLYRSGDIGRWLTDGNIELRGRRDFMVKIRGFRVEPGEIESKILAVAKVRECVVVVKEDELKQQHLVAYLSVEDESIQPAHIRRILAGTLPQYMIPKIIILDSLPLMPNGKVDRDNLPDPRIKAGEDRVIVPAGDEVEQKLVDIWSRLLSIEVAKISIDDNFFELGGHSLKATTMMAQIHKELDAKVELVEIFKTPTVRDIASIVKAIQWIKSDGTVPGENKNDTGIDQGVVKEVII